MSSPDLKECSVCFASAKPSDRACPRCGSSLRTIVTEQARQKREKRPAAAPDHDRTHLEKVFRERFEKKGISPDPNYLVQAQRILLSSENQMRRATIVFFDLSEFVKIVDSIGSLKASKLLSRYYDLSWQVFHRYHGFVVKHVGDAVLAVFGAPLSYDRDAESCVRATLEVRDLISSLDEVAGLSISCHAGIATGEVFSGALGQGPTREYDVTGSAVNLAARLQQRAKPGEILLCRATALSVEPVFDVEPTARMRLKNVQGLYTGFRLLGENRDEPERRMAQTRFVGRPTELRRIHEALTRARGGQLEIVEIVGEPGIGKSRLASESIERFGGKVSVLSCDCVPYGSESLLLPLVHLVQQLCEIQARNSPSELKEKVERFCRCGNIGRVHAEAIQYLIGVPHAIETLTSLPFPVVRQKAFDALAHVVLSFARRGLCVLRFDDIQWMDSLSASFLEFLSERSAEKRLVIMLLYRTGEKPRTLPHLSTVRIQLGPLPQRYRYEVLKDSMGRAYNDQNAREAILDRAAGNPLFLEEAARLIAPRVGLKGYPAPEELSRVFAESMPDPLYSVLQYRIDRLEHRTKAVLERAAVLGRRFSYNVIRLFETIRGNLLEQLSVLRGLQFLEENPQPSDIEYAFLHPLAREVAYQNLPDDARQLLHGEIARRMEQYFGANLPAYYPTLSYHFEQAANIPKALYYMIKSGERAASMYANREALQFYERAHEIARQQQSGGSAATQQSALLVAVGRFRRVIGDSRGAVDALQESLQISERIGCVCLQSTGFYELSALYQSTGDYRRAEGLAKRALEIAQQQRDKGLQAQCLNVLGLVAWGRSDLDEALEHFRSVLALGVKSVPVGCIADVRNNLCAVYWQRGEYAFALSETEKSLKMAQELGDRYRITASVMNKAGLQERLGQYDRARKSYVNALRLSREIRYAQATCTTYVNLANLDLTVGRQQDAMDNAARARELSRRIGDPKVEFAAEEIIAMAFFHVRDFDSAHRHFGRALRLARALGDEERQVSVRLGIIEMDLEADKRPLTTKRTKDLLRAIENHHFGEHRPRALRNHARILMQHADRIAAAEATLREALVCAKEVSNVQEQTVCQNWLERIHKHQS